MAIPKTRSHKHFQLDAGKLKYAYSDDHRNSGSPSVSKLYRVLGALAN